MDDETAFLRTIVANPADDAPWLIYADWLDEHERPAAGFVRVYLRDLQDLAVGLRCWPEWITTVRGEFELIDTGDGCADLSGASWPAVRTN